MTYKSTATPRKRAVPRLRKRRGPQVNVADMVRDYKAKMGIRPIAEKYGISYGKAHDMLHESGVEMRPRGGYHPVCVDDDETEGE